MKYSHTEKLTISITAKRLYKICTPVVPMDLFQEKIRDELFQCCCGSISGGYEDENWEDVFFYHLVIDSIVELTDFGKSIFTWDELK